MTSRCGWWRHTTHRRHLARALSVVVIAAVSSVASPAGAEPGFGASVLLPTDVGPIVSGATPFGSISCPSVGNCVVSGPLANGSVGTHPTVVAESDGQWGFATPLAMPGDADLTAGEQGAEVSDAVCWEVGACVAVGDFNFPFPFSIQGGSGEIPLPTPFIAVETDGSWQTAEQVPLTEPANEFVSGTVQSVSCDAEGNCTAVGYESDQSMTSGDDVFTGFEMSETSGSGLWSTPTPLPAPTGMYDYVLPTAISCVDASDCTVVEFSDSASTSGSKYATQAVTEVAGTWGSPQTLPSVPGRPLRMDAIACPAVGDCVAGGVTTPTVLDLEESTDETPAVATELAGVWQTARDLPLPVLSPPTVGGDVASVSCVTVNDCVAVGALQTETNGEDVPMAAAYNGTWSYVGLDSQGVDLGASDAASGEFTSVACDEATKCEAVGAVSLGSPASGAFQFGVVDPVTVSAAVTAPRPPTALSVRQVSGRVYVSFAAPKNDGGTKISNFVVRATARGEPTRTCHTPSLGCYFTGAVAGHQYRVTATATNVVGTSPPSVGVDFRAAPKRAA